MLYLNKWEQISSIKIKLGFPRVALPSVLHWKMNLLDDRKRALQFFVLSESLFAPINLNWSIYDFILGEFVSPYFK